MKIIILAGGGGSRLFPLSRSCYPKQFLKITGEESLLGQTVKRFLNLVRSDDIVIVTNKKYIFHVQAELKDIGASNVNIIAEPEGKNTAPAIALAMEYCKDYLHCDDNEIIFVSPSDHVIKPAHEFCELIQKCKQIAADKYIVTLGITPTKPETGYGYIEATDEKIGNALKVNKFTEKPDKATASEYLAKGNYFWNSGMFMFSINMMERELEKFAPEIMNIAGKGYDSAVEHFSEMPDISIDYAVAEHSDKIAVVPMQNIYWNDIGSFDAIADMLQDENGNTIQGDVVVNSCKNTMIWGNKRLIAGIDLNDLMIVDTPDVLLVAKKGESQKVKDLVNDLKAKKRSEVTDNVTMYRPWGKYTILSEGEGYKVKKIIINPGQKLSLQMHYHRSEHWTVISGTGKLTLDDKEIIFRENESTYIPIGTRHRLENPGKIPLAIIEVQNGKYLGEDDIIRFDDIYGRLKK
ncbi:mannose-1-phosphate guanylyltransferase/mannose-6-phosphate isomerase [Megasphaera elsdenii]|jgi:mannose-1-phosphate guanylyltransferase/mannose-6-phosphate isomerase|uniref:mannose-1-phosphate guanylyltransferase/mannose-6-phosphate isomerase n=1 Tax=Megasphaera elsdenii TaxID=907 RepID=UPI0009187E11|nr:mannose-1-phosphate guanylyltransferase/mannose-6-phosphate isomerase [Megasphaera elsdenii]SHK09239.1 mannose-1-phosphate guanylyltransferase / mannose-6-phosphate isomerase [Megasphaera elsdenii]